MARKTKDAPGRVTPKGGPVNKKAPTGPATQTSGRYTAPVPKAMKVSPPWLPWLILSFFVAGVLVILLNYVGVFGGHANNVYLFVGLGLIVAGFIAATRWH